MTRPEERHPYSRSWAAPPAAAPSFQFAHDQDQHESIRSLLVGRQVVGKSTSTSNEPELMLDDGTVLRLVPNEGCGGCDNGRYDVDFIADIAELSNMIMAVDFETIETPETSYDDSHDVFRVFVFTDAPDLNRPDPRTLLWEVSGSEGNGYYGRGYWLEVYRP